jgi:hypothetical protein
MSASMRHLSRSCARTFPLLYYRRAQDFRCKVVADDAHGLGSIYVQLAAADASFAAGQVYGSAGGSGQP